MYDLIRNILTMPLWTIGITVMLWTLFTVSFELFKLSETQWKRLEYIWIFTGFIGILTIIDKNHNDENIGKLSNIKSDIKFNMTRIDVFLHSYNTCFQFRKSTPPLEDFEQRQYDQDQICNWSKLYKIDYDSIEEIPAKLLDTSSINSIKFKTSFMDDYVSDFQKCCCIVNKDLLDFNKLKEEIKSNNWENNYRTFGPLLFILALAVRLSITTHNVRISKKKL